MVSVVPGRCLRACSRAAVAVIYRAMAISPQVRKLLVQALAIRKSQVPVHRVVDILATPDGDVSEVLNRFHDITEPELRRSLHFTAELLRELEREAGLTPAWEPDRGKSAGEGDRPAAKTGAKSATASKSAKRKSKFSPEDLKPFEDDAARGKVETAKAFVDGASKGNPGPAGIGAVIFTMDERKIAQLSDHIGVATNNIAEYTALIECLKMARRMGVQALFVLSDSELMVKQMNGVYKIKNVDILHKVREAKELTRAFKRFTISHIGREHNTLADALSTEKIPVPSKDKTD